LAVVEVDVAVLRTETWWALPAIARIDRAVGDVAVAQGVGSGVGAPVVQWLVGAAFAIGAAWFLADWRACARPFVVARPQRRRGGAPRAATEHLRAVDAEIRTVRDSPYAAVSGYLRPTIWMATSSATARRSAWHCCTSAARAPRDPLKVLLLTVLRRTYWWNRSCARSRSTPR